MCSSLVFVVCCVGSSLCDGLIFRPEESYRVSVCVCVRERERSRNIKKERDGLSSSWAVAPGEV